MKKFNIILLLVSTLFLSVCAKSPEKKQSISTNKIESVAVFAGGCFWCMQPPFDYRKGVIRTEVGYTGGKEVNPTYHDVAYGKTSHAEAVRVYYDSTRISYDQLLDIYWRNINPTDSKGQFVDRGSQYEPIIFYLNEEQKQLAEKSKKALAKSKRFEKPITVRIVEASTFYRAEEYHQDYYIKNESHYYKYRRGSRRDLFIKTYWKDD